MYPTEKKFPDQNRQQIGRHSREELLFQTCSYWRKMLPGRFDAVVYILTIWRSQHLCCWEPGSLLLGAGSLGSLLHRHVLKNDCINTLICLYYLIFTAQLPARGYLLERVV